MLNKAAVSLVFLEYFHLLTLLITLHFYKMKCFLASINRGDDDSFYDIGGAFRGRIAGSAIL